MVSLAIYRDLGSRYGAEYRIVRATSGAQALGVLTRLALRNQLVALIAADQRMPEMTGIEMLELARIHAPNAKHLLLTAYADTDVAIKAINDIGLDYYLLKPWDPPEERLYPVIDDLLGDWRRANPDHTSDVRVVGNRWSDRSYEVKTFLARNHVPYRWYDIERDAEGQRLSGLAHTTPADLPLVLVAEGEPLRSPSTLDLAGSDLTQRAVAQVFRFGGEMVLAHSVVGFETRGPVRAVLLDGTGEIEARAVIAATGVSYRRLSASGVDELTGRGVYYGATASEASQCQGDDVYIVGAANSAGQAAVSMARFARRVVLLVRAATLKTTMSRYLIEKVMSAANIEVRYRSEVGAGRGDGHLEALTIADRDSGLTEEVSSSWLLVFIGASPRTDWLGPDVVRDDKGFVITGQDLLVPAYAGRWPLTRAPFALETSVPGLFAAGDVRLDSMKRVASAVGEGAMSVYLVHRYLATI